MKVLLINGSPNKAGCTYTALTEAAKTLNEEGIDADFFWLGRKAVGEFNKWRESFAILVST